MKFEKISQEDREKLEKVNSKFIKDISELTEYKKQVNAFACIMTADYYCSKLIFNDEPLSLDDIKEYIREDTDEAERYMNIIIDTANANINNFYDNDSAFPPSGQIWGKLEKTTDGKGAIMYYDFIPTKLHEILDENGISWNSIKKKLLNQGYIEVDRKGKYQVNARINGTQQRVIKVKNIYFNDD